MGANNQDDRQANSLNRVIEYGAGIPKGDPASSMICMLKAHANNKELSVRDKNLCNLLFECGSEFPDEIVMDPQLLDKEIAEDLSVVAVYGACYEVACTFAELFRMKGVETALWLGFVDFFDEGQGTTSHLHAFLTKETDGKLYIFDPINARRTIEGHGGPTHYCGFPIPYKIVSEWHQASGMDWASCMWFRHLFTEILNSNEKTQELINLIQSECGLGMFPFFAPGYLESTNP